MPDVLKTDTKINGYFINNYNVMFLVLLGFASIFGSIYALALIYNKFFIKKLKI